MCSPVNKDHFGKIYKKELLAHRLEDPDAELARLQSNKKVQKVFNRVKEVLSIQHKIALGHVAEIRNRFKKQYYVLMHGQNPELMVINLVAEKLQAIVKGKPAVAAIPLRHPCFTKSAKACHKPKWYRKQCTKKFNKKGDGDGSFKTELICADALLSSNAVAESANYFASSGHSNFVPSNVKTFVMNNLKEQLKDTFPHKNIEPLLEIFEKLFEKTPNHTTSGGNLYAICIPKKKFKKCGYVSADFGVTHPLSKKQTDLEIVNKLQHDKVGFGGGKHSHSVKKMTPQVRLVTSTLTPDNGVRIMQESLLPAKFVDWMESIIEEVIARAHKGESFASIKKDIFSRGFKKKTESTSIKEIPQIDVKTAIKEISNSDIQETEDGFVNYFFKVLSKFFVSFFKKILLFIKS